MDQARKAALRAKIEQAFAPRVYPGDENIGREGPGCTGYEGTIVTNFFKGKDWREIAFQNILEGYDAPLHALPAFMKPEGFAFYLPAFLLMALDITSEENSQEYDQLYTFAESLCFYLTKPSPNSLQQQYEFVKDLPEVSDEVKQHLRNPTPEARQAERALVEEHQELVDLLSGAQRVAVKETLEFLADFFQRGVPDDRFNQARRALQTTWGQFGSYS